MPPDHGLFRFILRSTIGLANIDVSVEGISSAFDVTPGLHFLVPLDGSTCCNTASHQRFTAQANTKSIAVQIINFKAFAEQRDLGRKTDKDSFSCCDLKLLPLACAVPQA